MKNTQAKMRTVDNPYEVWETSDDFIFYGEKGKWTWKVLKKWQVDDNKKFARWFCFVTSPLCPEGEYGDVYVSDIKNQAVKIK